MSTNSPSGRIADVSQQEYSAVSRVRSGSFTSVSGSLALSYVADRETRLCFTLVEHALIGRDSSLGMASVDCCVLQRVPRMRPAVPWLNDERCRSGATPPPPASATAPR
jgi:hypothetical protein